MATFLIVYRLDFSPVIVEKTATRCMGEEKLCHRVD